MKIIIVNGTADEELSKKFITSIENTIDMLFNDLAVINTTYAKDESKEEVKALIAESYPENDYDAFIYAIDSELRTKDEIEGCVTDIIEGSDVSIGDVMFVIPTEDMDVKQSIKEFFN